MILVTGGTGRIGKALLAKLIEREERVCALVRDEQKAMFLPKGVEPYYGDITKKETLMNAFLGVDRVVHLAAVVDYRAEYGAMRHANVEGTRNLLEACPKGLKRFVHGSSVSVYGYKLSRVPADEETPCNPSNNYGKTKLAAEKEVLSFSDRIPSTILRFGVAYGRGFDEAYIPVLAALEKQGMPILGSGKNRIHFIHASDVVDAIMLALDKEVKSGSAYNVCGPDALTQQEIFGIACKCLGVPAPKSSVPVELAKLKIVIEELAAGLVGKEPKLIREYIDVLSSDRAFSCEKARKELGFEAKVKLDEGIREMVEYYRSGAYAKQ